MVLVTCAVMLPVSGQAQSPGRLPLTAWAAPFAQPGRSDLVVPIVLAIGQEQGRRLEQGTEMIEFRAEALTPERQRRATQSLRAHVAFDAGANDDIAYELLSAVILPPGRYQLRLTLNALTRRAAGTADVKTGLPFVPTTQRLFHPDDKGTTFARLHQGGSAPPVPMIVAVSVIAEDGTRASEQVEILGPERFVLARGADVLLTVPVADLDPGAYRLRLESRLDGVSYVREARFTMR